MKMSLHLLLHLNFFSSESKNMQFLGKKKKKVEFKIIVQLRLQKSMMLHTS